MNTRATGVLWILVILAVGATDVAAKQVTDSDVRKMMIADSIASYPGNCPCPYNLARNSSRCGGRSAYSRPGGYAPLCYPSDISKQMVDEYRRSHGY